LQKEEIPPTVASTPITTDSKIDKQLTEQLNFIYKVSSDIGKITLKITPKT